MISKKSNKANLEKKKPLFFEIGVSIALAFMLLAFEVNTLEKRESNSLSYLDNSFIEELEIEITRVEKKEEMKKPKAIQIEIVDNNVDLPDPDIDLNTDIDPDDFVYNIPDLPEEDPVEDTFIIVEDMPEYRKGGLINFHNHIQEIVKYPQEAIELNLEGTVYVSFVVDKKGDVIGIKILRGIDPLLDREVIAAIEQSEKWKPGMQTGRKVNVSMSMPVTFRLQ